MDKSCQCGSASELLDVQSWVGRLLIGSALDKSVQSLLPTKNVQKVQDLAVCSHHVYDYVYHYFYHDDYHYAFSNQYDYHSFI
jgi:hypothetical protein